MSKDRGGLRSAFSNFKKPEAELDAERKLLGRTAETNNSDGTEGGEVTPSTADSSQPAIRPISASYLTGSTELPASRLIPRPILEREPVRQLSFRCPLSAANALRRKAAFNQLEQQEILLEGLRRVLAELPEPPAGWNGG